MISEPREKPVILVVDDEPDELLRSEMSLGLSDRAEVDVLHPSDLESQYLTRADLVLVDYKLDHWTDRRQPDTLKIRTGLALAAVLQEFANETSGDQLTAFALQTGHLSDIQGRIRPPYVSHVVARLGNLEWAFGKRDEGRFDQMVLLGEAAQDLSKTWPADEQESISRARDLLDMDENANWFERGWRDVSECQPPIHELVDSGHGVLFLRWLLHQILPYPCFLWDTHHVAARLRMHVEDLKRLVKNDDSELARDLRERRYSGILAGFLGTAGGEVPSRITRGS